MLELSKDRFLELIDKISFFEFFTSEEKEIIANIKSNMIGSAPGDYIIRQGEPDQAIYLLLSGKAKVTKKEKNVVTINILKKGDLFGEIAFFSQKPRSTNVIALEDTMVLKMDWSHFGDLDETIKNKVKDKLIEVLIGRLEDMNKVLTKYSRI